MLSCDLLCAEEAAAAALCNRAICLVNLSAAAGVEGEKHKIRATLLAKMLELL